MIVSNVVFTQDSFSIRRSQAAETNPTTGAMYAS